MRSKVGVIVEHPSVCTHCVNRAIFCCSAADEERLMLIFILFLCITLDIVKMPDSIDVVLS